MGKWNKAPPEVSEQFLQNEQRRKQMIIEAAKRRKEKQKKLQQQVEIQKKSEEQALLRHKQEKKEVIVKYLRNNMHDKYEEMKRNEKLSQPQVRSKSKWKKEGMDSYSQMGSEIKGESNLQGLDLEVNMGGRNNKVSSNRVVNNKVGGQVVRNVASTQGKRQWEKQQANNRWGNSNNQGNGNIQNNIPNQIHKNNSNKSPTKKQSDKRRMLQDQFQNMWKQQSEVVQEKQFEYDLSVQETIFDDMMGSKLLDSLDLDLDTVSRGKKLDKQLKDQKKKKVQPQQNKEIDQIKNIIGYESLLMSIDQRGQMIKKYNQFMVNQVPQLKENLLDQPNQHRNTNTNKAFSKNKQANGTKHTHNSKQNKNQPPQKSNPPMNQGQVFNQLKNKKQGKILNWAKGQVEQADDLFSNCSTNKKSKTRGFQLLKQINKQIHEKGKKPSGPAQSSNTSLQQANMKKKQKPLQTIPQKKINSSLQKIRQRSFQKKQLANQGSSTNLASQNNRSHQIKRSVSKQKVQPQQLQVTQVNKARVTRINSAENKGQPPQPPRNNSKERVNKTATNSFKQTGSDASRVNNMTQPKISARGDGRRSLSKEKEGSKSQKEIPSSYNQGYSRNPPLKVQQTGGSARLIPPPVAPLPQAKKLPHLPPANQYRPSHDQITIATQDQVFEVESFIKNELLSLNREQRQLQQELKNIHIQNKDKLKQVQKKYQIKTDYKFSFEIRQKEEGDYQEEDERSVGSYGQRYKRQTEDELEESIQRLDDMLLRKEINNKEKNSRITEQDNESELTHKSLINPMTDPITLHKQVLQLAQNLSRFQGQPEDPTTGYGARLRMMKKKSVQKENKTQNFRRESSMKKKQTQIQLSQSQDVNFSQLNSVQNGKSKVSKTSKVSKPPQFQYSQSSGNPNIPTGYNESDILDDDDTGEGDGLEDSIQKGKIQVNQRLRKMLLE